MAGKRRNHSASFKAKVALEAAKETATVSELAGKHQVHPSMVTQWKRQLLDGVAEIFSTRTRGRPKRELEEKDDMLKEIGRLKMELEWLKKKQVLRAEGLRKLACVVPSAPCLGRQLELLGLARSSYYYEPRPAPQSDIELAERIDRLYTDMPFYGSRRMGTALGREGCEVGRKRVVRLMEEMGLEAIYPKPRLSAPGSREVGRRPLPPPGCGGDAPQPCLVGRHHVHPHESWAHVPGGRDRLVQPVCFGLAALEHVGLGVLRGSVCGCVAAWRLQHPQHRPREPVHLAGVRQMRGGLGGEGQLGWAWQGIGQRVHRTVLVVIEV